ncbi:MAG: hypothetical protein BWK79_04220 [Beggiatoa sp. IS2]|nr:MAG: hypothetical protein BWK79_04220 [Beggiatoa sp. IS2]
MKKYFLLILLFLLPAVSLSEPATLREKIPADALGYVRIPNPWDFLASPTLTDKGIQQSLQSAIGQNVFKKIETVTNPTVTLLLSHLRSPLEVTFLLPQANSPIPLANVLTFAKLDLDSLKDVNELLKEISKNTPSLKVVSEFSQAGYAALVFEPLFIFLYYDTSSKGLYILAGPAANQETFERNLQQLVTVEKHPMYELENKIDTSHQGLFQWINLQKILTFFQATIPAAEAKILQKWGFFNIRGLASGWGTREGKGRLQLILDAPKAGYRELLPHIRNTLSLTAAGKPDTLLALALPALDLLKSVEKVLAKEINPESLKKYQHFKETFVKTMGVSIEDVFGAFGPEILVFSDEVGEFLAIKVADSSKMQKVLDALVQKFKLEHEIKTVDDKQIHHLAIPLIKFQELPKDFSGAEGDAQIAEVEKKVFFQLITRLKNHYYWVEDAGYLVMAHVPQLLLDRQRHPQPVKIQEWLAQTQRQSMESSLLFFSTSLTEMPRYLYYAYLDILNILNDLSDAKVDLFTLPTAKDLNLPKEGTYGMQLDVAESSLSLEWVFENNPLDFMATPHNSMTVVAIIGIVAAVAIPAYSDYLKRAKVAEGLTLLSNLKTPAEEFFAAKERLPTVEEISAVTSGKYAVNLHLLESKDGYGVEFNDADLSGTLKLLFDSETRTWKCTHEGMKESHLPKVCRDELPSANP